MRFLIERFSMGKRSSGTVFGGMLAVIVSTASMADPALEGKELCRELQKNGTESGISRKYFDDNLNKLERPAGEPLSPELSAGLYLATYGGVNQLRKSTWESLKPVIDAIYENKIKFKSARFDVNNDGKDEQVLILNGEYPFNEESAYVVGDSYLPDTRFINELGRPIFVYGTSVIYKGHAYQADYRYTPKEKGRTLVSVVLYRPWPLNSAPGIVPLGAGPVCEIKII